MENVFGWKCGWTNGNNSCLIAKAIKSSRLALLVGQALVWSDVAANL